MLDCFFSNGSAVPSVPHFNALASRRYSISKRFTLEVNKPTFTYCWGNVGYVQRHYHHQLNHLFDFYFLYPCVSLVNDICDLHFTLNPLVFPLNLHPSMKRRSQSPPQAQCRGSVILLVRVYQLRPDFWSCSWQTFGGIGITLIRKQTSQKMVVFHKPNMRIRVVYHGIS